MVGNREVLSEVIGRITPEEYRGDWAHYADACEAAADKMRAILASDTRQTGDARLMDALREALPVRNEWGLNGC